MTGPSLSMVQTQKMDTSLLQVMEFLTMGTEELEERIKKEAEKNPVINLAPPDSSYEDFSSRSVFTPGSVADEANGGDYGEDGKEWFERIVSSKESLQDHLMAQLGCIPLSEEAEKAAEIIISSLDDHGFTGPDPEALLPSPLKPYLKEALDAVKTMEPTGVGAKDWKGAVMMQVREIEKDEDEVSRYRDIIYRGLDYIRDGRLDALSKALRIGRGDLDAMLGVLRTLTPFPGLKYSSGYTLYAVPELSFRVKDGAVTVKVLRGGVPSVEIDSSYVELRNSLKGEKDEKSRQAAKYLGENIREAENVKRMLSYRTSSLEKLGALIAERQKDFFLYGPMFLKGLTMTESAEELGVGISTISKIAGSKYADTPWGIHPLRFFFSSEVKKDDGDDLSKSSVKLIIKEIMDGNEGKKRLSDQKIADALKVRGITLARRTVAKYRAELEKE